LITSAPISAKSRAQKGPAATLQISMTRTPFKGPRMLGDALAEDMM
jgi:hypothetical protein